MFDVGALLQEVRQPLLAMVSPPAPLPSNLRFGSVEARALQVRREFYRLFHAEHLLWDTSDERAARVAYSRLWDTFRHGYNNRASNRAEARRHVAHRSFCNALTLLSDEVRFDQSWVGLLCWAEDAVSQYVCHYCDAELFAAEAVRIGRTQFVRGRHCCRNGQILYFFCDIIYTARVSHAKKKKNRPANNHPLDARAKPSLPYMSEASIPPRAQ